ncbi:bifunctional salicylyl-CoA 5-hydroxylase/oxidoreductase [Phenylobacterium sp.]|uniref:bifunctional salicylyl-CoA 5-hydroxylase/oxidoreductase n=1 Tax=Phenylobacterium sp. TaxID=1871053 RepID=UPI002FC6C544
MKVSVIGGGPAGLYAAMLLKKHSPEDSIVVHERNGADDTFGFGIVLSDETLGNLRQADEPSWRAISQNFAYWDDLYTHYERTVIRSTGHGFSGIERLTLLKILQGRCEELGVEIRFQDERTDIATITAESDLVIGADGMNSLVRESQPCAFQPKIDLQRNQFVWLGSSLPLPGFTYFFARDAHGGTWIVHGYQYKQNASTIVVETTPENFTRAGLDPNDEAATVDFLEALLKDFLKGHRLETNRSIWRRFPSIHCQAWRHDNTVLLGDAAHTAHFSIGSGTKLALEDAIALFHAVAAGRDDIPQALASYERDRREEVEKIQHAGDISLRWFENVADLIGMDPIQFNYSLLSRSKQITHENLRLRDPGTVAEIEQWFARTEGGLKRAQPGAPITAPPPPMFHPFRLRDMSLDNRVVVSPMCQYSARDGAPNDWHLMHLGARAVGGAGLIITEMTAVSRAARITPGCAGMYKPSHQAHWKRIVDFVHRHSPAKICLQLGHAGRKGSTQLGWEQMDHPLPKANWPIISASAIPYFAHSQVPRAMNRADMDRVRDDFVASARMAEKSGFDMIELHFAHGYLLASFLSPVTNCRTDRYGGSAENRLRFPLEVFDAVRAAWPAHKPMSVRLSATDWIDEGGLGAEDAVSIARALKERGCDLIDVSSGQTAPESKPVYGRMYQTIFAEQIRLAVAIPTIAVGAITTADQANTILAAGRADLVALARPHLSDPNFTLNAAAEYDIESCAWPVQYLSGRDQLFALKRKAKLESQGQTV